MKKEKVPATRVYLLVAMMALWAMGIGARLYYLQVVQSAEYRERAQRIQQRTIEVPPRRGIIYDRDRKIFATSVKVDSVYVVPSDMDDLPGAANALSTLTGVPAKDLLRRFDPERSFAWVKRQISDDERDAIKNAKIPGVHFQEEYRRFYPQKQMAAHVLGYVNIDGKGGGGLEHRFNDVISGVPGKRVLTNDARRVTYERIEQPPQPGANLITTLDGKMQHWVESEMARAVEETQAAGIYIIVMDPRDGAILAMANHPTFNPNEYRKFTPDSWINRAVSQTYEPGSTFKIVTAMGALEEHLTTPDELIDCLNGSIVLHNHRIRDHKPFGVLSVREIMQYSSDVGMIKLGLRLGEERFAEYIKKAGFGRVTSMDLQGEERGHGTGVQPASKWSKVSIGAISMGQEIAVTPLQIVSMVSAVANGGTLYRPYVVQQVENPDGTVRDTVPSGERIMSAKTAEQLKEMLEVVVTDGTARSSRLDGYRAAGKTGTAQKIDPKTRAYSDTKYVASFAGYAPASNPEVAIVVVVDEPSGRYHGGEVAAPIFKRIAERVLQSRSVVPDVPEEVPRYKPDTRQDPIAVETPQPAMPQDAMDRLADSLDWRLVNGSDASLMPGEVVVPDFSGQSLRQVAEESLRLGIRLRPMGSGRATAQLPPAGSRVGPGASIQVNFSAR